MECTASLTSLSDGGRGSSASGGSPRGRSRSRPRWRSRRQRDRGDHACPRFASTRARRRAVTAASECRREGPHSAAPLVRVHAGGRRPADCPLPPRPFVVQAMSSTHVRWKGGSTMTTTINPTDRAGAPRERRNRRLPVLERAHEPRHRRRPRRARGRQLRVRGGRTARARRLQPSLRLRRPD
jgi:hypothetical protein